MIKAIESSDFSDNLRYFEKHFQSLEGARIAISGASGFVGNWIAELLFQIAVEFQINFEVVMLTRDEAAFRKLMSETKPKSFTIVETDISKEKISLGSFSHAIHAATPTVSSSKISGEATRASLEGARNFMSSLANSSKPPVFINLSSGAVYGFNPLGAGALKMSAPILMPSLVETFSDEYAAAKIETEKLVDAETIKGKIVGCNPRLFAFFGPLLPIDQKYAIGNFMQSAINKNKIILNSSGKSERSYLHASDLASQIIYLLSNPIVGPSHIGSTISMPLIKWAEYISEMFNCGSVATGNIDEWNSFYVPESDYRIPDLDTSNSRRDLLFKKWFEWLTSRS